MVQAVRADDRLRGAGVAVRVVLARPDAFGLLGGSADGSARAQEPHRARAGPLQQVVRPPGGQLQGVIAWALDHRLAMVADCGGLVRRCARAAGHVRRRRLRAGERPERDQRSSSRRRRGRTWSTRASRRRRSRGSRARTRRCATRTPRSARALDVGAARRTWRKRLRADGPEERARHQPGRLGRGAAR